MIALENLKKTIVKDKKVDFGDSMIQDAGCDLLLVQNNAMARQSN